MPLSLANKTALILKKVLQLILFVTFLLTLGISELFAQGGRPVLQLSGIVVGEDSTSGVPGVHVYVPKAGRGTTTNYYGYFSLPALVGDSIVVSAIGYTKQHFIVPATKAESLTVVIELTADTTYLPMVDVFPFPTEELFKEAILALRLPSEYGYMAENMNADVLASMLKNTPMDGMGNYRFYQQQQMTYVNNRYGYQTNNLLNPFAWSEFIRSIKRGDLKKKNN